MDAMIEYGLGSRAWAEEVPAWEAHGGTILSVQTMSTGTGYDRVQRPLDSPAQHIAALGEFARTVKSVEPRAGLPFRASSRAFVRRLRERGRP
jgi:hypothetical protein